MGKGIRSREDGVVVEEEEELAPRVTLHRRERRHLPGTREVVSSRAVLPVSTWITLTLRGARAVVHAVGALSDAASSPTNRMSQASPIVRPDG
ncbi:hypothetical protein GCM10010412_051040 [Nonomuraea recticatena]|uniref:Uncharacterized protein n=1 Tax=Nonomuraea recticatena TaxID=46178 RepID=A0ABP6ENF7_9ACTN